MSNDTAALRQRIKLLESLTRAQGRNLRTLTARISKLERKVNLVTDPTEMQRLTERWSKQQSRPKTI